MRKGIFAAAVLLGFGGGLANAQGLEEATPAEVAMLEAQVAELEAQVADLEAAAAPEAIAREVVPSTITAVKILTFFIVFPL